MTSQKLFSVFLVLVSVVAFQAHADRLVVEHHPSYQVYDYNSGILKFSDFKDILLAAHGFSINKNVEWKGLKSTKPLAVPKKTFLFLVNGDDKKASEDKSIKVDLDESLSMDSFNKKFSSVSGNLFKTFDFLPSRNELKTLEAELPKSIDSFFLTFKVAESDSEKLKELIKSIKEDDSVVYVLETDSKQREKRDVEKRLLLGNSIVNRAIFYSDNYPVTFHLIFWTSLILGLAIIGITCGMGSMDPGLDTVIYRMTSQRIKKDN